MKEKIELEIAESLQEDVDKGIARLPSQVMDSLKIVSGDVIELKGKSKIITRALRDLKSSNKKIIRIDGTTRSNIGASIGDKIEILVSKVELAKSVTLSPMQEVKFSNDPTEYFHSKLLDIPLTEGQQIVIDVFGTRLTYIVSKTSPKENSIVTPSTKLIISDEIQKGKSTGIRYEDIGGLKNEIQLIREMIELPMKHPEVFQKLGVGAPKGVLLTGPPGTGKTLLAKAVATETDANFVELKSGEFISAHPGETEKNLKKIFEDAAKNGPSIIFIDELDSIGFKRENRGANEFLNTPVMELLKNMDGLKSRGQVVVMAATNRPDDLDEALRRPGRFDRELKINAPDEEGRKEILRIHTRGMPIDNDVNFDEIAFKTIGFTGADIEVLCKEAALKSIKPYFAELKNMQEKIPTEILDKIKVSRQHFIESLKQIEPSAMREIFINKPHVQWEDIGGLDDVKEKLRELVELPLLRPDLFLAAGITPSKGILLSGPSGTGKTLLAKAVATESNANFISVKGPELISKWVGESEKHIRDIFKKARQVSPSIIFFDEFDSISKERGSSLNDSTEKVVNQLLTELDGVEELEKVIVIAATNRKDLIDQSLLRPGRIDTIIDLGMPDKKTREKIFEVHIKNMPLEKNVKMEDYVKKTEGWTGADIYAICREAGMNAIKKAYKIKGKDKIELKITKEDFDKALEDVSKSTGKPIFEEKKKEIEAKTKK